MPNLIQMIQLHEVLHSCALAISVQMQHIWIEF